jgi:hypothetical protein
MPAQPQAQAAAQPDAWFVQTSDGSEYGPVTKAELEQWITEDRLDSESQILQEGWTQWKWAEDVFPQLAGGGQGGQENPFAGLGDSGAGAAASSPFAAADQSNPYAAPQAASSTPAGGEAGGGAVTQKIIRHMDGTRPWVLFFCVLTFIVAGFAALGMIMAIFMLIAVPLAGLVMFALYGALGGIYGYIGYLLLTYSKAIGLFTRSRGTADLEKTTEAQMAFWKTVGILTIVMMGLMVLSWILMFAGVMAGVGAMRGMG